MQLKVKYWMCHSGSHCVLLEETFYPIRYFLYKNVLCPMQQFIFINDVVALHNSAVFTCL